MIKQNKLNFSDVKMLSFKNLIIISILFILFALIISFVVIVGPTGFNDIDTIFHINKNLLIIIPISSSSLAISSLILQQLSKNRLADNSILGIGNINLFVLMILIYAVDFDSDYAINNYQNIYPFIFIIISIVACLIIYLISYKKNKNISKKFIIVGVILNFTFISLSTSLDSFLPPGKSAALKQFLNGFIDTASDLALYVSISSFLVATIWLFFIYEKFKICSTNFLISKSLGVDPNKINLQALIITGILSGTAYILVGNVSFLGLIAGNAAYSLFKKNYNYTFPASCMIGSIILGFTFLINKNILNSNINTAGLIPIMGIPYFIFLLAKDK